MEIGDVPRWVTPLAQWDVWILAYCACPSGSKGGHLPWSSSYGPRDLGAFQAPIIALLFS